jgi:hypothetical protein
VRTPERGDLARIAAKAPASVAAAAVNIIKDIIE